MVGVIQKPFACYLALAQLISNATAGLCCDGGRLAATGALGTPCSTRGPRGGLTAALQQVAVRGTCLSGGPVVERSAVVCFHFAVLRRLGIWGRLADKDPTPGSAPALCSDPGLGGPRKGGASREMVAEVVVWGHPQTLLWLCSRR